MVKSPNMLAEAIRRKQVIVGVNVWDCMSAKIAERAGFQYASISGYQVAGTAIGKLDIGLMTMTEMVNATRNIAHSVKIPVLTDAEQGYGNAIHVIRTVKEVERAGAQAIFIDDKVMEQCPWLPNKSLRDRYWSGVISEEEMIGKVKAAASVRSNPDFMIKFRSNARGPGLNAPPEPAIYRCKLAIEAGADIVHANIKTVEELRMWDDLGVPLDISLANSPPFMRGKTFGEIGGLARNIRWLNAGTGGIRYVAKKLFEVWTGVRKEGRMDALSSNEMSQEEWMNLYNVDELTTQIEKFIPPRKA